MGIEDRDWYRDEIRKRQPSNASGAPGLRGAIDTHPVKPRTAVNGAAVIAASALIGAVIASIARDMKDRGVPFSWHGFKWWLSLWFGNP